MHITRSEAKRRAREGQGSFAVLDRKAELVYIDNYEEAVTYARVCETFKVLDVESDEWEEITPLLAEVDAPTNWSITLAKRQIHTFRLIDADTGEWINADTDYWDRAQHRAAERSIMRDGADVRVGIHSMLGGKTNPVPTKVYRNGKPE